MMARSTTRSNQRPDTLMQDRICQVEETSCNARPDHTLGVKLRRTQCEQMSSGLPLKADIARYGRHVSNGRVEDGRDSLGHSATLRFPSPLIEPDVPISGIRLSDWLHREVHGEQTNRTRLRHGE